MISLFLSFPPCPKMPVWWHTQTFFPADYFPDNLVILLVELGKNWLAWSWDLKSYSTELSDVDRYSFSVCSSNNKTSSSSFRAQGTFSEATGWDVWKWSRAYRALRLDFSVTMYPLVFPSKAKSCHGNGLGRPDGPVRALASRLKCSGWLP